MRLAMICCDACPVMFAVPVSQNDTNGELAPTIEPRLEFEACEHIKARGSFKVKSMSEVLGFEVMSIDGFLDSLETDLQAIAKTSQFTSKFGTTPEQLAKVVNNGIQIGASPEFLKHAVHDTLCPPAPGEVRDVMGISVPGSMTQDEAKTKFHT